MDYKTNWKDFLQYEPTTHPSQPQRRRRSWPAYVVDTAPGEKNYMWHDEYEAMLAAEEAVKNARRAAREAELAASRVEQNSDPGERAVVLASRRAGPPDFERHSRRCVVCSHPDRDAIEGEFIRWRSPHKIIRDYNITDRNSIYRHAHAANLFEARRRQVARVLESYLETIDDNPPADFDPVTRAVRVYAHLSANGDWFEPPRSLHITHSHSPNPNPAFDPDFDPDPEPSDSDPHRALINRLDQEMFQVPVGTTEGSPGRESWERERPEPPTSGASPSAALSKDGALAAPPSVEHSPRSDRNDSFPGGRSFSSDTNEVGASRTSVELLPRPEAVTGRFFPPDAAAHNAELVEHVAGSQSRTLVEQSPRSDRSDSLPCDSSAAADTVLRVEAPEFTLGEQRFSAAEKNAGSQSDTLVEHSPRSGRNDSFSRDLPAASFHASGISDTRESSQVPLGTAEGSPARECGERGTEINSAASAAPTSGPALRDRPLRASHKSTPSKAEGDRASYHETGRDASFSRHSSLATAFKRLTATTPKLKITPIDCSIRRSQKLIATKMPLLLRRTFARRSEECRKGEMS